METLAISCQPAYGGTAVVSTTPDGQYLFPRVPVGASCTIAEAQPQGYGNAFNTRGMGAFAYTGSTGSGNSTISLVVPAAGSGNNNFAEMAMADTTSQISCLPVAPGVGETVTCTATCTNHGPVAAAAMTCTIVNVGNLPGSVVTGCNSLPLAAVGATITCTVSFVPIPGLNMVVAAGSGASNDTNGGVSPTAGNNPSSASISVLRPVDEPLGQGLPIWISLLVLLAGLSRAGSLRRFSRRA